MRRIHRPMVLRELISANADSYFENVVLLLHGDGSDNGTTFTDSSRAAHVPSSVLTPVVTSQGNQKFGTAALNFTGGRIYYDDSADFDMGAGDFTVETWFNLNAVGANGANRIAILGQANNAGGQHSFGLQKAYSSGKLWGTCSNGSQTSLTGTTTLVGATWYHAALVRDGDTLRLFLDGVQEASAAFTGSVLDSPCKLAIGGFGEYNYAYGGQYGTAMAGLLDDVRITKGVARYTTDFPVPTAPFPHY